MVGQTWGGGTLCSVKKDIFQRRWDAVRNTSCGNSEPFCISGFFLKRSLQLKVYCFIKRSVKSQRWDNSHLEPLCVSTLRLGTITWEWFHQVASKGQPTWLKSDTDSDSLGAAALRSTANQEMRKPLYVGTPAGLPGRHIRHGKQAVLWGKLVSRVERRRGPAPVGGGYETLRIREGLERPCLPPPATSRLKP